MNMCRICLSTSTEMDISQLKLNVDDISKTYLDILYFCLNIKIEADMDEHTKLCRTCFHKVLSFYEFKCLALKSDEFLKNMSSKYEVKKSPRSDFKLEDTDLNDNEYLDEIPHLPVKNEVLDSDNNFPNFLSANEIINDDVLPKNKNSNAKQNERKRTVCEITKPKSKPTTIRTMTSNTKRVCKPKTECKECGKKVSDLQNHTQKAHRNSEKRKMYECDDCGKKLVSYLAMNYHYQAYHGLKDSILAKDFLLYTCKICWRRFDDERKLNNHMLSHTRPFVCEICGKSYGTKYRLKVHHQQNHEKIKRFSCPHCPKKYFVKDALNYHLKAHHTTTQQCHVCPECGKSFRLRKSFTEHLRSHRTTKEYVCQICADRAFKTQGCLYAHMLTHQERRHQCHCGAKFTRKEHLNRHQKAKHGGVAVKTEDKIKQRIDSDVT